MKKYIVYILLSLSLLMVYFLFIANNDDEYSTASYSDTLDNTSSGYSGSPIDVTEVSNAGTSTMRSIDNKKDLPETNGTVSTFSPNVIEIHPAMDSHGSSNMDVTNINGFR